MRVVSGTNLTLQLEPTLLQRYSSLRECVYHSALNDPRGLKAIAADCDLSVSELSRRLNPSEGDARSLDVDLMVAIMRSTRDLTPLHYQNALFFADDETTRRAAVDQLAALLPRVAQLVEAAGSTPPKGRR